MNLMDFDPRSGGTLRCCDAYGGRQWSHRLPLKQQPFGVRRIFPHVIIVM
jgi:hypothetical protein